MKAEILKILKKERQLYISGEQLSKEIGVTRTAIWKHIQNLRAEGYEIKSIAGKGYKLISSPEIISAEEIKAELDTQYFGNEIAYFDSVGSTNTIAKEMAFQGCNHGQVVIADQQTAGRGRLGRDWISPKETGIWMSIVARPNILPEQAPFITLITAVAVVRALKETLNISAKIKWPNDIILNNKKACGILTEMSLEMDRVNYVVIGIGINVNNSIKDFPWTIRKTAISLNEILGKKVERKVFIRGILENFENLYIESQAGKLEIIDEYKKYSITLGKIVKVTYSCKEIEGTAINITDEGELVIKLDGGTEKKILSGEVSIRGISGYV